VGAGVIIEVTSFTVPCANVRGAFLDGDCSRVSQKRYPGWSRVYARVLVPGEIQAGDPVVLSHGRIVHNSALLQQS
jgi:MOSC domain-containing protein YiiM